jgi:uncharacterized protein
MTSYGSQPTPRWPGSGPASSAQPPLPDGNGGEPEVPEPWPERQGGSQAMWRTAEGAPWPDWPDWPDESRPGQAAQPQPSGGAEPYGMAQPPGEAGSYGAYDRAEPYGEAEPSAGPGQDQPGGPPGQDWQARPEPGRPWPLQPLSSEPASGQWSAQLRRQAPAAGDELTAEPAWTSERWAMLSYLGIPFLAFVPPLLVYLIKFRSSPFARQHATQALNLSLTVILYSLCAVIAGGLLALDSLTAALVLLVPVLAALWLVTLAYLILAATAASRGEDYRIPGWLCATLVR